jgi:carboxypeptidase Taq
MKNYFELSREIAHLGSAYSLVYWDFETQMPKGTSEWRSETLGHFAGLLHEKSVSDTYLKAAEAAYAEAQDPIEREALRKAVKDIKKKNMIPQKLVEEMSQASAVAHGAWVEAKKEKNFSIFAPHLEKMIRLSKEHAKILAQGGDSYDALLEEYSPGMTSATVTTLFNDLRPKLQDLIGKRKKPLGKKWSVPIDVQEKICHDVVDWMGFSREHLTQARSAHPFCLSLHPSDVRITTRYNENDPLMSLLSTVHELGHALYELQLPQKNPGTPHMSANGMDLHESQSRLWEVCLATSPEFYRWVYAWFKKNAPAHIEGWTADELFLMGSEVTPSLIRTESDPVTYGMHVMIRFELERAIFDNKIQVADLPKAWNEAYTRYLGVTPANDVEGILQDSHWSNGSFGYFPSYLLGTMIACQLYQTLLKEKPQLMQQVERGEMKEVQAWLKTAVHQYGRGKDTQAIMKDVTGKELSSEPFLTFLQERFLA